MRSATVESERGQSNCRRSQYEPKRTFPAAIADVRGIAFRPQLALQERKPGSCSMVFVRSGRLRLMLEMESISLSAASLLNEWLARVDRNGLGARHMPYFHFALAFHIDGAPRFADKLVLD